MLDAWFSHLHFCQSLPAPQRGLSAIADLLVTINFQGFTSTDEIIQQSLM